MSSEIAIKVENLSKCYYIYDKPQDRLKQFIVPRFQRLFGLTQKNYMHEFWALRDISFEVRSGESIGILGRNGSGKSTLLQAICGILTPTMGKVEVNGRVAALLELGSGFNPEFSGRENVYLNGSLLGLSEAEIDNRFDEIASFADIGQFIDQPIKTYSSGMIVRLAFSVQVQLSPDILIIDEALAVGDALFQKRCFRRIEKLLSDGLTLLFVSHDVESIRTLTHKSLLLDQGISISWGISSNAVLEYRKLLHKQESAYFDKATRLIADRAKSRSDAISSNVIHSDKISRSDKLSFGEGGVKIVSVKTLNQDNEPVTIFYPDDILRIRVICFSKITSDKLNIAVRIRNKEGIKICSWGTLNQDIDRIAMGNAEPLFWNKNVNIEEHIEVEFEFLCKLGPNLYEIQASVSYEKTPDYLNQTILHWCDEAAFFQVLMKRNEYFFGGIVDLCMKASWKDK